MDYYFLIILTLVSVPGFNGFHTGAPCTSQFTMSPSAIFHGIPQNSQNRPPPYHFDILDSHDAPVKSYREDVYKIKLTGSVPFRGFIIQVRPAAKEGYPIGHLRVGEFIRDSTWENQGIQVQPCAPTHNDSITHSEAGDKTALEVTWRATKNYGPILFVVTIVQTRSVFWTQWIPSTGFLMPDDAAFKASSKEPDRKTSFARKLSPGTAQSRSHGSTTETTNSQSSEEEPEATSTPSKSSKRQNITNPLRFHQIAVSTGPLGLINAAGQMAKQRSVQENIDSSQELRKETVPGETSSINSFFESRTAAPDSNTVEPEVFEGLKIILNKTGSDLCFDFPCFNNGTCRSFPKEDRFECICTSRWTGKQCEIENTCENHKCRNGAECIVADDSYTCKCKKEFAGVYCERDCPSYLCDNGGTCILIDDGHGYGCACAPGWTGEKCRQEIDLCQSQPCEHGATCIHKFNAFECKCKNGYMGERCRRPCQDIYKSCAIWDDEERCESTRTTTKFFDTNCAAACRQCVYDNRTILTDVPLPPILEPFDFLIGRWAANISIAQRFPLDFTENSSAGYEEEITFSPTPVPMFGTPSINYSAIAKNNRDPKDVRVNVGFLTLKSFSTPLKVSLMSTGNEGVTIIEEGILNGTGINLATQYFAILPTVDLIAPAIAKRQLAIISDVYLRETVERLGNDGQKSYFVKYFQKQNSIPF